MKEFPKGQLNIQIFESCTHTREATSTNFMDIYLQKLLHPPFMKVHCFKCRFFHFCVLELTVHGLHNLRPCTGLLFPVYSRSYYGLCNGSFFTYPCTVHFQWTFLRAAILQRICRNSDGLSVYTVQWAYYFYSTFWILLYSMIWHSEQSVDSLYGRPGFESWRVLMVR